jgi:tryptophan halogenase
MNTPIKKIVILGGGTAGWIAAALLKKILAAQVDIELVESDEIGRIGVGEATIPPIRLLNETLGINEADFLRETKASIKLGIQFEHWHKQNHSYMHSFGVPGKNFAFCPFHHFWLRSQSLGNPHSLWHYDLNYLAAMQGKFAPIAANDQGLQMLYAYHFDAGLYANLLRRLSESLGVKRREGMVSHVIQDPSSGNVTALVLQDGIKVSGDFFIDCSGLRALLIQQTLAAGFDDWQHWLPCDRAIAIPSARFEKTLPYTRAIAHDVGWQWQIPLQHRNGNGLVYSSHYVSDDEAMARLINNLASAAIGEPNLIRFITGRRRQAWIKNVVAVGLSSGFLEPLESTSIHLIQSAVVRLLNLFPHQGIEQVVVDEYNRQSRAEFESVRDFIIFHYVATARDDSQFWRDRKKTPIPDSLRARMEAFNAAGYLAASSDELFRDISWLQVFLGQGLMPRDYHPLANSISAQALSDMLDHLHAIKQQPLAKMPHHDEFLMQVIRA